MKTKNLLAALSVALALVIGSALCFFRSPSPVSQEAVEQTHNATPTTNPQVNVAGSSIVSMSANFTLGADAEQ